MNVTHPEMVAALVKPGADILSTLDPHKIDLIHMAVGIAGEAGEIIECVGRYEMTGEFDRANMVEELGDIEFYLEGFRQAIGIERFQTTDYFSEAIIFVPMDSAATLAARTLSLLDLVKKVVIYNKTISVEEFIPALRFIECWMDVIRTGFGITRSETLSANIAKLSVRYAGLTYSDQAAQTRADKAPGE